MKEDIRFPLDVCKCRACARFCAEGVPKALLCSLIFHSMANTEKLLLERHVGGSWAIVLTLLSLTQLALQAALEDEYHRADVDENTIPSKDAVWPWTSRRRPWTSRRRKNLISSVVHWREIRARSLSPRPPCFPWNCPHWSLLRSRYLLPVGYLIALIPGAAKSICALISLPSSDFHFSASAGNIPLSLRSL